MKKNFDYDFEHKRYRNWTIVLYRDSVSYDFDDVIALLRSYKNYCYIKHLPEADEKSEHYHFNLYLDNGTYRSTLSSKIGVPENYIEVIDSVRRMNRYLTHIDFDNKLQYDFDDIVVSRAYYKSLKKCYDDLETEFTIINKIYDKIDDLTSLYSYSLTLKYLLIWVSDECYESIYKKYRFEFNDYIKSKF